MKHPFLVAALALSTSAPVPASAQSPRNNPSWLLRLADSDRDGNITQAEWRAFEKRVTKPDAALDAKAVLGAAIQNALDVNNDGACTNDDLAFHFATLDSDKNGSLSPDELGRPGTRRIDRPSVARVLARFADVDADGTLTAREWKIFVRKQNDDSSGPDELDALHKLLLEREPLADERLAAARPGAFTWRVALLTAESSLDVDGNGARDAADLRAAFTRRDANGDGALSEAELRAPLRNTTRRPRAATRARRANRGSSTPCMPWQRSLDDALELQRRSGKPLLICVNVDGEPACERLAANRYRDPDFAALADRFICLLACPTRHTLRDYDDRGRRILDPKFGRVTSYEHVTLEPQVVAKYFAGRRVAPRHFGVDRNGKVLFDIYLTGSLAPIDEALRKHGLDVEPALQTADATLEQLLDSPDAAHRAELEARFRDAKPDARAHIARRALDGSRSVQHPELLRMALRAETQSVRSAAMLALAAHPSGASVDYFPLAFARTADDGAARAALVRGLHVLARDAAADSPLRARATELLGKYAWGAAASAGDFDATRFEYKGGPSPLPSVEELDYLSDEMREVERALKKTPADTKLQSRRAWLNLRYARIRILQGQNPSLFLDDARDAAQRALRAAPNANTEAMLAWASYLAGDIDQAALIAERALPRVTDRLELAPEALWITIDARIRAIYRAIGDKRSWPDAWVRDVQQRQAPLLTHYRGRAEQALALAQFWQTLECYAEQHAVLVVGAERFPDQGKLHEQLRATSLYLDGAAGLERDYARMKGTDRSDGEAATLSWYTGFAAIAAAERHTQNGNAENAIASYKRAIHALEQSAKKREDFRASADWYACLASAACARLQARSGDITAASSSVHRACALGDSARFAAKDGLGRSVRESLDEALSQLRARLDDDEFTPLQKRVREAAARTSDG